MFILVREITGSSLDKRETTTENARGEPEKNGWLNNTEYTQFLLILMCLTAYLLGFLATSELRELCKDHWKKYFDIIFYIIFSPILIITEILKRFFTIINKLIRKIRLVGAPGPAEVAEVAVPRAPIPQEGGGAQIVQLGREAEATQIGQGSQIEQVAQHKEQRTGTRSQTWKYVTRASVDRFIPIYTSKLAYDFDYLEPQRSFSRIISLQEFEKESSKTNIREIACCICLDDFDSQKRPFYSRGRNLILFPCHHYFHFKCVKELRKKRKGLKRSLEEDKMNFRCFICNLSMIRVYLFYKQNNLDFKTVPFENKSS